MSSSSRSETRLVDLQSGTFSTEFDTENFDPRAAANDPELTNECAGQ